MPRHIHTEALQGELIDAYHFLMNLMLIAGMTGTPGKYFRASVSIGPTRRWSSGAWRLASSMRRSSSAAIASCRWCPGMPSWKAIASSSKVPHDAGSSTLMKNVPPRLPSPAGGK